MEPSETIGVFGGSFDPPHIAHAMCIVWALESGAVDRVAMVPAARHAFHKARHAPYEHCLAMCRLAVAGLGDRVLVSDAEGLRPGFSYMIDTLATLIAGHPAARFRLIVGSDVAAEVATWREGPRVKELAPPLEIPRGRTGERVGDRPFFLPNISSTAAREALRSGGDCHMMLCKPVREYIRRHGLYGLPAEPTPSEAATP